MSCNCIEKIRKQALELDANYDLRTFHITDTETLERICEIVAIEPVRYRKMKKDGGFQQRKSTLYFETRFCPYCGTKYVKDKE